MLTENYISNLESLSKYSKSDRYVEDGIDVFMPFIDENIDLYNMLPFKNFLQRCSIHKKDQFISTGSFYCVLRVLPLLPKDIKHLFSWHIYKNGVIALKNSSINAFIKMNGANVMTFSLGDMDNEEVYFRIKMTRHIKNTLYAKNPISDFVSLVKNKIYNQVFMYDVYDIREY